MTAEQAKLQDALNTAYFAFEANPSDKSLAAAYNDARDALFNALTQPQAAVAEDDATDKDLTFYVTEEDDGLVVHYVNANGSEIWSEWCESLDDVRLVYRDAIKAGQFTDITL